MDGAMFDEVGRISTALSHSSDFSSSISLPYVVRLRQCLIEFLFSPQYSNTRALLNAIKYFTAFPVIFLSAAQRLVVSELVAEKGTEIAKSPWHGEHQLFRLW